MYKQFFIIAFSLALMMLAGSCTQSSGGSGGNELAVKTDIS